MDSIQIMRIDGKAYREAKAVQSKNPSLCVQCAFNKDMRRCSASIDGAAKNIFGGDCDDRDVIYEEVKDYES